MKKQFSFSVTADSMVARYMECIGHKRGAVLEALVGRHLHENRGYLSQDVAAEARYRFTEKDRAFAEEFLSSMTGEEVPKSNTGEEKRKLVGSDTKIPVGRGEDPSSFASLTSLGMTEDAFGMTTRGEFGMTEGKATDDSCGITAVEKPRDDDSAFPEVRNKDMVLAGLSAFLG